MRLLPSLFSYFVSPSRVFLSTVPSLCLVVLCAHCALPGSFDIVLVCLHYK
jgi:hypothetical protein